MWCTTSGRKNSTTTTSTIRTVLPVSDSKLLVFSSLVFYSDKQLWLRSSFVGQCRKVFHRCVWYSTGNQFGNWISVVECTPTTWRLTEIHWQIGWSDGNRTRCNELMKKKSIGRIDGQRRIEAKTKIYYINIYIEMIHGKTVIRISSIFFYLLFSYIFSVKRLLWISVTEKGK